MGGGSPFETGKSAEGELLVSFNTPLTYENAAEIWQSLSGLVARKENASLVFDFSGVSKVDSAGVALVRSIQRLCDRRGVRLRIESVQPPIKHFFDYLERETPKQDQPPPPTGSLVAGLGALLIEQAAEFRDFVRFCGSFLAVAGGSVRHLGRFRRKETFYYLQSAGPNAMAGIQRLFSKDCPKRHPRNASTKGCKTSRPRWRRPGNFQTSSGNSSTPCLPVLSNAFRTSLARHSNPAGLLFQTWEPKSTSLPT